ncbi:hypothetical protein KCU98_g526, partial [Aureobasidium melanogenum]
MCTPSTLLSTKLTSCTLKPTRSSVPASVTELDQRRFCLLLPQLDERRSSFSASASASIVLLWSHYSNEPQARGLLVPSERLSGQQRIAQLEAKSDGALLALVPRSAARLSLVRFDGSSDSVALNSYLDPSMTSMSFSLSLLADAMAFSVHDALHMTHESQPALKSYIKVDDQLRAFSVTLSPLQRIFRSNQLLAMPSSYQMPRLDSVHRHHVILKLAAVNDFTTLHTYLRGTATHDKKISQFFDVADAEPASTFCTFY